MDVVSEGKLHCCLTGVSQEREGSNRKQSVVGREALRPCVQIVEESEEGVAEAVVAQREKTGMCVPLRS